MGFLVAVALLIIVSLAVGTVSNNSPEATPSLVEEEIQAPLATPTPLPTPTLTPIPTFIPTPTPNYLSRLTKCLQDMANDSLNQEIKKDRELLNNTNSSNFQCTSSPLECQAQISREKAGILARLDTNNLLLGLKYDCYGTLFPIHTSDDLEKAWLIKDINSGDNVIIERRNGEQWLLEAKTWCSWCWRYEGRQVYLKFGYATSKLINDDGDVSEFWTEDEL